MKNVVFAAALAIVVAVTGVAQAATYDELMASDTTYELVGRLMKTERGMIEDCKNYRDILENLQRLQDQVTCAGTSGVQAQICVGARTMTDGWWQNNIRRLQAKKMEWDNNTPAGFNYIGCTGDWPAEGGAILKFTGGKLIGLTQQLGAQGTETLSLGGGQGTLRTLSASATKLVISYPKDGVLPAIVDASFPAFSMAGSSGYIIGGDNKTVTVGKNDLIAELNRQFTTCEWLGGADSKCLPIHGFYYQIGFNSKSAAAMAQRAVEFLLSR